MQSWTLDASRIIIKEIKEFYVYRLNMEYYTCFWITRNDLWKIWCVYRTIWSYQNLGTSKLASDWRNQKKQTKQRSLKAKQKQKEITQTWRIPFTSRSGRKCSLSFAQLESFLPSVKRKVTRRMKMKLFIFNPDGLVVFDARGRPVHQQVK